MPIKPAENKPTAPDESTDTANQPQADIKPGQIKSEQGINLISEVYTGTAEQTFMKSPMVPSTYELPYNPDDLWRKKGDYSIYEDMLQDDQVSVCLKLKKDLVLGSGFYFLPGDDGQEEIVDDLYNIFETNSEIPFNEMIEEILTAYEFGLSITEKVFKVDIDGKLKIKFLKTRHPNSFLIYQDDKGNILRYEQKASEKTFDVNPKSIIHLVNNRRFQNPYGTSDLRAAYAAWFAKRQIVRYYAIFLEKSASPIPVARYDKNAPETAVTAIHDAIKRFQTKTALTIPKDIEVQFLETSNVGDAYQKAIGIFNMFIARSLMIPDLVGLGGEQTGGGSYALGKEQINLFFMHINRRRQQVEALINHHIVKPLLVYNYGFIENPPMFKFSQLEDSTATEYAKIWIEAVKSKLYEPNDDEINHFRQLVKFPEGPVEKPEPVPQPLNPNGLPVDSLHNPSVPSGQGMGQDKDKMVPSEPPDEKGEASKEEGVGEKKTAFKGKLPRGSYHKKVDFKAIKAKLDDYDNSIVTECRPVLKKIFSDLADQIEKKKILQTGNVDRISSIKVKYLKELKQTFKSNFLSLYKDAQIQAAGELLKGNYAAAIVGDKFLALLEHEMYDYVGTWAQTLEKKIGRQLVAAIKDQASLGDILDILEEEGQDQAIISIERFVRTKNTEIFNKGRLDAFKESGVVVAVQFSAIIDSETSDICGEQGLDGKIFEIKDAPVPPLHFNCRSTLIPITKYEEYEVDTHVGKVPIDKFIDDNKGADFPIK